MTVDFTTTQQKVVFTDTDGAVTFTATQAPVVFTAAISGPQGVGVPAGGATGEVLTKTSATDYDTAWAAGGGGGASLSGINVFRSPTFPQTGDVGEIVPVQIASESAIPLTVEAGVPYRFDVNFSFGSFAFNGSDPLGGVAMFASYFVVEGSHTLAEVIADSTALGGPGTYTYAREGPLFFVVNAIHSSAISQTFAPPSGSDAFGYTPTGTDLTVLSGLVIVYEDGSFGVGSGANPGRVDPYISGTYWKV